MQLLIQTQAPGYAAWKAAFDAEPLGDAGLSLLQIWKAEGGAVLVLFEVHNRPRAEAWLAQQAAFGKDMSAQFLQTA